MVGGALFTIGLVLASIGIGLLILSMVKKLGKHIPLALLTVAGVAMGVLGITIMPDEDSSAPAHQQEIVAIDASQLVLRIEDFGAGWVRTTAEPSTKESALSVYHVYYHEGGSLFPAVVQNTVAVYPTIEIAQQVYLEEKPTNVSLIDPALGDESFLDVSVPMQEHLVFRKSNIVVWVWLQQAVFENIKTYAQTVEKRL